MSAAEVRVLGRLDDVAFIFELTPVQDRAALCRHVLRLTAATLGVTQGPNAAAETLYAAADLFVAGGAP